MAQTLGLDKLVGDSLADRGGEYFTAGYSEQRASESEGWIPVAVWSVTPLLFKKAPAGRPVHHGFSNIRASVDGAHPLVFEKAEDAVLSCCARPLSEV